jgi:regulator of replication initiation timing
VSVTNALAARNERQSTPVRDLLQLQSRKADEASRHKEDAAAEEKGTSQGYGQSASSPSNEGFRRFYSAFGDVITAFSAPLAFTALPLLGGTDSSHETSSQRPHSPPEPKPKQSQKSRQKPSSPDSSRTSIKSSEPDLASLISKPALHALRDNQSGTPLGPFAKNESFYLVPTSGGTISYASIVRDPAHPHHAAQDPHLDSIAEGDGEGAGSHLRTSSHEEFVDARESIGPPSPTKPRRHGSTGTSASSKGTSGVTTAATIRAGRGTGLKTMEELLLENETLRAVMDKQAKRLSMWETTSQNSYHALAQSFRARGGYATAGGFKQQNSDPTALAQALAGGAGAPPVPPIPAQFQGLGQGQSAGGGGGGGQTSAARQQQSKDLEKATRKIAELEARLGDLTARLESVQGENAELVKENQHMAKTIGRYREQWEKLKAGARRKEVERREREKAMAGEAGKEKEGEKGGEGESEGKAEKSSDENGNENGNADGVIEDEAGVGFGKA